MKLERDREGAIVSSAFELSRRMTDNVILVVSYYETGDSRQERRSGVSHVL